MIGGLPLGKRTVGCILLIAVIGLGWSLSMTSYGPKNRTKVLEEFYSTLINSSLESHENQTKRTYELIKSLLAENSTVNADKLSILLEPKNEELNHDYLYTIIDISYVVGKEIQGMMGEPSEVAIPVTIIVKAVLTDLLEEKEITKQKKMQTHLFLLEENNEWKISDFDYIDDVSLLAF